MCFALPFSCAMCLRSIQTKQNNQTECNVITGFNHGEETEKTEQKKEEKDQTENGENTGVCVSVLKERYYKRCVIVVWTRQNPTQ